MTTIFIAGSITIHHLHAKVQERIMNIVHQDFDIVVGDAAGADTAVQRFLRALDYRRVSVFCSGAAPRNNIGHWPVHLVESAHKPGTRAFFTAKDLAMAAKADSGLMIWDARSTGTLGNVIELLSRQKYSWVFIDPPALFQAIKNIESVDALLDCMTASARMQAETRIGLHNKLKALRSRDQQSSLLPHEAAGLRHASHYG